MHIDQPLPIAEAIVEVLIQEMDNQITPLPRLYDAVGA